MMRRAERPKAGSHTVYRSTKTVDDTRDGEPPAHCGRRPRGGALLKADQREIETSRGKNDGVGTGHRIVVFFCVSCFAGKWKGKSAARGMDLIDKKGTTVPNNRLSRLQDQFKIGTRPAAGAGVQPPQQTPKRLSFAPLAAPVLITGGFWGFSGSYLI